MLREALSAWTKGQRSVVIGSPRRRPVTPLQEA